MRTILLISLFITSCTGNNSCATTYALSNKEKVIEDTFRTNCDVPKINELIADCDTVVNVENYKGHLIRCFDKSGHLLRTDSTNLYENDSRKIYTYIKEYDTAAHLIYESASLGLVKFHCYVYNYDNKGHLINKSGYSSGELGVNVTYIYEGDKLVKEITERPGQKTEKTY